MAQYDVYTNPSRSATDGIPYVVVIQSDLLDALATLAAHKANLPRATNAAVEPVPAYSLAPRR
jgi:hypothetical protein